MSESKVGMKTIRLDSECENDGKLYYLTDSQYDMLKNVRKGHCEWPDQVNKILEDICRPQNEVVVDCIICTTGDCYGFYLTTDNEADSAVWGRMHYDDHFGYRWKELS